MKSVLLYSFFVLSSLSTALLQAQVFPAGNGIVLRDLRQLDLHVDVSRLDAFLEDATGFRLTAQHSLESALSEQGIVRQPGNWHHLVCRLDALQFEHRLAYTVNTELWRRQSTDVHSLLWSHSAVQVADIKTFSAASVAAECRAQFLGEWQRWNSNEG